MDTPCTARPHIPEVVSEVSTSKISESSQRRHASSCRFTRKVDLPIDTRVDFFGLNVIRQLILYGYAPPHEQPLSTPEIYSAQKTSNSSQRIVTWIFCQQRKCHSVAAHRRSSDMAMHMKHTTLQTLRNTPPNTTTLMPE